MMMTIKPLTSTFFRQSDNGKDNQEEQEKVEFHIHFGCCCFFIFVIRFTRLGGLGLVGMGALI